MKDHVTQNLPNIETNNTGLDYLYKKIFVREWLRNPLQVAAFMPSGRYLARLISSEISDKTGPVLEMGPGTGIFTSQLLENGVPPHELILLEKNEAFARLLRKRFPALSVYNMDAASFTVDCLNISTPFGAAVSGMGVLSMPRDIVRDILQNCFDNMTEDGALYQFTYSWHCPIPKSLLTELGLTQRRIGHVWRNFPPACVYKINRC